MELLEMQRKIKEHVEQMVEDHATLLGVQEGKWPEWKEADTIRTKQRLDGSVVELQAKLEEYRSRRKELELDEEIEFEEDEIKEAVELKVQQKAEDFYQGVARAYVTFVSMKTKLVVEHYLRAKTYKKLLELPQRCVK